MAIQNEHEKTKVVEFRSVDYEMIFALLLVMVIELVQLGASSNGDAVVNDVVRLEV